MIVIIDGVEWYVDSKYRNQYLELDENNIMFVNGNAIDESEYCPNEFMV
jgi:hypothetical protein